MTDLERLSDDDGELGAAFRAAEGDVPPPGARDALLATLSLGAATTAATALGSATAAKSATQGAAGIAKLASSLLASWKVVALSAVVVSSAVVSVHVATRPAAPLEAPGASSARLPSTVHAPLVVPRVDAVPAPAPAPAADDSASVSAPSPVPSALPSVREVLAPKPPPVVVARVEPDAPKPEAPAVAPGPLPVSPPDVPASTSKAQPSTRVADEVAMLDRAKAQLAAGNTSEALAIMNEFGRAFPHPVLYEEALVLRVEALVRQGRRTEAEALARPFLEKSAASPVAARIRRALEVSR